MAPTGSSAARGATTRGRSGCWSGAASTISRRRCTTRPTILPKLRVYFIGGPNKMWSVDAYDYIERHIPTVDDRGQLDLSRLVRRRRSGAANGATRRSSTRHIAGTRRARRSLRRRARRHDQDGRHARSRICWTASAASERDPAAAAGADASCARGRARRSSSIAGRRGRSRRAVRHRRDRRARDRERVHRARRRLVIDDQEFTAACRRRRRVACASASCRRT